MGSHVLCDPAPLAFSCAHAQLAHLYGTEPAFTQFMCLLSAQTLLRKMMLGIWPHEGWSPGLARPLDGSVDGEEGRCVHDFGGGER